MAKIEVSIDIDSPVERVFELCTDLGNAEKNIEGIQKLEVLTPGPVGVGTQFRETRVMFGKEATEEMEITEFEPNKSYRVEAESCGARYVTDYSFEPFGSKTLVKMMFTGTPVTFAAKLMSPMLKAMSKTVRKCLEDDLACIKKIAEQS